MRRDVEERLDRVLREALVVDPPPELQARLMALVQTVPVVPLAVQPAAPERRGALWLDPNVWLIVAALATLVGSAWSVLGWLAGLGLVLGDVPEALVVLASSPLTALVPTFGLDLTSLALWSAVGAVGWVLAASGALEAPGRA
jgi:hypothetical protein